MPTTIAKPEVWKPRRATSKLKIAFGFVSDSRREIDGVCFHPDGFMVATDGRIMIVIPEESAKGGAHTILRHDGSRTESTIPNFQMIIPKNCSECVGTFPRKDPRLNTVNIALELERRHHDNWKPNGFQPLVAFSRSAIQSNDRIMITADFFLASVEALFRLGCTEARVMLRKDHYNALPVVIEGDSPSGTVKIIMMPFTRPPNGVGNVVTL